MNKELAEVETVESLRPSRFSFYWSCCSHPLVRFRTVWSPHDPQKVLGNMSLPNVLWFKATNSGVNLSSVSVKKIRVVNLRWQSLWRRVEKWSVWRPTCRYIDTLLIFRRNWCFPAAQQVRSSAGKSWQSWWSVLRESLNSQHLCLTVELRLDFSKNIKKLTKNVGIKKINAEFVCQDEIRIKSCNPAAARSRKNKHRSRHFAFLQIYQSFCHSLLFTPVFKVRHDGVEPLWSAAPAGTRLGGGGVSEQRINTESRKWKEGQKDAAKCREAGLIVKTGRSLILKKRQHY